MCSQLIFGRVPKTHNKERTVSSINGVENWVPISKRRKLDSYVTPNTKINSNVMEDLNVRSETVKLLEENRGKASWHLS